MTTSYFDDPMKRMAAAMMAQQLGGFLQQQSGMQPLPQPNLMQMDAYRRSLEEDRAEQAKQAHLAKLVGGFDPVKKITWNTGRVEPQGFLAPNPETEGSLLGASVPAGVMPGRDYGLLNDFTPRQRALFQAMPDPEDRLGVLQEHAFSQPRDPLIREFKEDNQIVTKRLNRGTGEWEALSAAPRFSPRSDAGTYSEVMTDEQGRQYQEGPHGKRHYLPDQGQGALPSVSRNFVLPLLTKVQSGEPLSASEQQAWDMYSRTGLIDQMLRGMQGGVVPTSYIPTAADPSTAGPGATSESQYLSWAREAIADGEDRSAVEAELRGMGINPSKL